MRTLALDCATEACTVALFEGDALIAHRHETIGRGHAEHLIPLIAALPDKGRVERIDVGLGPGSFTGTRIGLSAARALALAWGSTVRGFATPSLVAASARKRFPEEAMSLVLKAGHGQVLVQSFDRAGTPESAIVPVELGKVAHARLHPLVVSDFALTLADSLPEGHRIEHGLPDAKDAKALPPTDFTDRLAPIYARPPDATPQG